MRLTVADSEDARLSDYVRLRETSLRRHLESERGLFIAEGEKVIRRAIAQTDGNISGASRLLGVSRPTLYDLLKSYDLHA